MKPIISFFIAVLFVSCADGKERSYTGSTPAGNEVKIFLGIPLADSIDFIRWKLTIDSRQYILKCNYGMSKPNTNGFMNGGKQVELKGTIEDRGTYFQLTNSTKILKYAVLNADLLQLLDDKNNFLTGNGGWSYTLNSINPFSSLIATGKSEPLVIKDSVVFVGRTPCGIPDLIPAAKDCYKIKWKVVLFSNANKYETLSYKIAATPWRRDNGQTGTWKTYTTKNGLIMYVLTPANGSQPVYLLKPGENILLFTDANENCLVGNEDFSYTLNRY